MKIPFLWTTRSNRHHFIYGDLLYSEGTSDKSKKKQADDKRESSYETWNT